MAQKELYELKKNSIKAKYRNRIDEISKSNPSQEELDKFKEEALAEIKEYKKEKYNTIIKYEKKIKLFNIIADIILLIGIGLFSYGLYALIKKVFDSSVGGILLLVGGAVTIIVSAVFFAIVMQNRQNKEEYIKDSYSETELVSTKSMINEFCDSFFQEKNN